MPFDQPTRNRLARFVGEARLLLTEEFTRQMQHEYGLDPDSGEITPIEKLTALDDARRETAQILRETLEYYLAGKPTDDKARKETLERILREQAFTVLNRNNALEKNFDLKEGGTVDGIEWVDAQPKSQDSGFQHLRIGFVGDALRAMELTDSFGQVTTIAFEKFESNPQLPASLFRFTPPAGADILGE